MSPTEKYVNIVQFYDGVLPSPWKNDCVLLESAQTMKLNFWKHNINRLTHTELSTL